MTTSRGEVTRAPAIPPVLKVMGHTEKQSPKREGKKKEEVGRREKGKIKEIEKKNVSTTNLRNNKDRSPSRVLLQKQTWDDSKLN